MAREKVKRVLGTIGMVLAAGVVYGGAAGGGVAPDPKLTPGAADPRVTQRDIAYTICFNHWARKVRPRYSTSREMKVEVLHRYGLRADARVMYEMDHLIPLELGGHPVMRENLWPQLWPAAKKKDWLENRFHYLVCSGQMKLKDAQRVIAGDWLGAYAVERAKVGR